MFYFNDDEILRIKRLLTKFQRGSIDSTELNELEIYCNDLYESIKQEKFSRVNE